MSSDTGKSAILAAPPSSGGEQILPLVSTTVQASSSATDFFFSWTTSQLRETFICFIFAMMGWYLPKFFTPSEQVVHSRPIPYLQLGSGETLLDFRYNNPVVDPPTISSRFLIFTGVWVPLMIVLVVQFCRNRNPKMILCSLFTTIGMSEAFTNMLKFWVRRPRPNFYALCGFDLTTHSCTAPFTKVLEAQLSFPSGHTSLSFCSTTVLALWFYHITTTTTTSTSRGRQQSKSRQFLGLLLPWGWAGFVGVSRIVDYWHHPSDVLAGCILGTACATICYTIHHSSIPVSSSSSTEKDAH